MARTDAKLNHLSQTWLFSSLSKRELSQIGRAAEEVTVGPGRTLCEQGETGREFFLILDGQATVRRNGRKVAALGPGQYFGELSLLDRGPRSATVISDTDMDLLVLAQREFNGVLDEIPGLAHKLLGVMAARVRQSDAKAD